MVEGHAFQLCKSTTSIRNMSLIVYFLGYDVYGLYVLRFNLRHSLPSRQVVPLKIIVPRTCMKSQSNRTAAFHFQVSQKHSRGIG